MTMEWISVNDRLPEKVRNDFSDRVLVVDENDYIVISRLDTEYNKKGHWTGLYGHNVTHWMPLPSAPNSKNK